VRAALIQCSDVLTIVFLITTISGGVVRATIIIEATLSGFIDRPDLTLPTTSEITLPGLMLCKNYVNTDYSAFEVNVSFCFCVREEGD